ncbi:MAG TPA: formimidoylglutamate deiminase [Devosia sp.]|nr:formimidoylglutamate deiminase [Devosia sp.]
MAIHAKAALLPGGWQNDVRLELAEGRLARLTAGVAPRAGDERHAAIVPGMPNLHSHAFQRAMAGLVERRGPGADSFWTWRELMYRFALSMTPDDVEAVAAQLYVEMLEAGFTRVGEFHYLHHDGDGRPYADIGEMAGRIVAAARATGIGLTLLPVFYAHAGFGGTPPGEGQRRFINDIDSFGRLLERSRALARELPGSVVGVAPHSLRAVTPDELAAITEIADSPIHIHIAEQVREVEDCLAWSGTRPVEWLFDHAEIGPRWCLIHATHMTDAETARLAASGAVAGLCPITEANLGDGIFPGAAFLRAGGRFGVGSDSNVLVGVGEELRQLEYSQRLAHRARNVLAEAEGSTGRSLFAAALAGGAQALGTGAGLIEGGAADFVSLDLRDAPGLAGDAVLDGWIFAGNIAVDCVWVAGRKQVEGGRHMARDAIAPRFAATMRRLLAGADHA